jgi:hypothetical protein
MASAMACFDGLVSQCPLDQPNRLNDSASIA